MQFRLLTAIVVFSYLFPLQAFAQKKSEFAEALILTKAGDTLLCFIAMQVHYRDRLEYRNHPDAEPVTLDAEDIYMVVTTTKILESVPIGGHEELMTLVVSGRANLYNSVYFTDASHGPSPGAFTSQSTSVSYVVKKDGRYHSIKRLTFKSDISELFSDCSTVIERTSSKEYKYMDMEAVVREYNACAGD